MSEYNFRGIVYLFCYLYLYKSYQRDQYQRLLRVQIDKKLFKIQERYKFEQI